MHNSESAHDLLQHLPVKTVIKYVCVCVRVCVYIYTHMYTCVYVRMCCNTVEAQSAEPKLLGFRSYHRP